MFPWRVTALGFDRAQGKAKPLGGSIEAGRIQPAAVCAAALPHGAAPTAASLHAFGAVAAHGVLLRMRTVVILARAVRAPFPHVAVHVEQPERIGPREGADFAGSSHRMMEVRLCRR